MTVGARDMGIEEVLSAPRSPWQRAYIELVIGFIRPQCLDHVIAFHEASLRRILAYITQQRPGNDAMSGIGVASSRFALPPGVGWPSNMLVRNEYLAAENRILRAKIKGRLQLSEGEKRSLAEIAHRLGRKALAEVAVAVKPDTILRWFRKLVARKLDGSACRQSVDGHGLRRRSRI